MATIYYRCTIIGDGKSTASAYRPAIADIMLPATSIPAFNWSGSFASAGNGTPAVLAVIVKTDDANAALVVGNPDIVQVAGP